MGFVELLWRSIKYEEVYMRDYGSFSKACTLLGRYLTLHNSRRPRWSPDRKTPDRLLQLYLAAA